MTMRFVLAATVDTLFSRRWEAFEYVQAQTATATTENSNEEPGAKRRRTDS